MLISFSFRTKLHICALLWLNWNSVWWISRISEILNWFLQCLQGAPLKCKVLRNLRDLNHLQSLPCLEPLTPERSKTLVDIGRWLRSCLSGTRRGLSGRERLPEGSSCYLVIRAHSGQVFDPVKVCRFFNEIQPLVKPRGSPGDSVFIGLPSYRDARLVVEAASLTWPEEVNGE